MSFSSPTEEEASKTISPLGTSSGIDAEGSKRKARKSLFWGVTTHHSSGISAEAALNEAENEAYFYENQFSPTKQLKLEVDKGVAVRKESDKEQKKNKTMEKELKEEEEEEEDYISTDSEEESSTFDEEDEEEEESWSDEEDRKKRRKDTFKGGGRKVKQSFIGKINNWNVTQEKQGLNEGLNAFRTVVPGFSEQQGQDHPTFDVDENTTRLENNATFTLSSSTLTEKEESSNRKQELCSQITVPLPDIDLYSCLQGSDPRLFQHYFYYNTFFNNLSKLNDFLLSPKTKNSGTGGKKKPFGSHLFWSETNNYNLNNIEHGGGGNYEEQWVSPEGDLESNECKKSTNEKGRERMTCSVAELHQKDQRGDVSFRVPSFSLSSVNPNDELGPLASYSYAIEKQKKKPTNESTVLFSGQHSGHENNIVFDRPLMIDNDHSPLGTITTSIPSSNRIHITVNLSEDYKKQIHDYIEKEKDVPTSSLPYSKENNIPLLYVGRKNETFIDMRACRSYEPRLRARIMWDEDNLGDGEEESTESKQKDSKKKTVTGDGKGIKRKGAGRNKHCLSAEAARAILGLSVLENLDRSEKRVKLARRFWNSS